MITFFNRRELCIVFSIKEQSKIRQTLVSNNIKYHIKVVNRMSPSPFSGASRGRTVTSGQNMDLNYEYIFYVNKKDYDLAKYLINK